VRVLGKLFRRLFLTGLIALHDAGRLAFFGSIAPLMAIGRAVVEDEQTKGLDGFLSNPIFG
jgi:hypothetical protein